MKTLSAVLLLLWCATVSDAADLKQDTLQAWDDYVHAVNLIMTERAIGGRPFLWVDESPDLGRRARAGEVLVASHDLLKVRHGLIHHWVGAIFIPDVTLDKVSHVLGDYDHYQDFYRPIIVKSKMVEQVRDREKVTISMMQKAFSVTAAVEIDDDIQIFTLDPSRAYSLSTSERVREIANFGRPDEQLLPEDRGPGYIWRTFGITRLEQRDGGVYVEMETVALSRGIPIGFRWLVKPLTEKLPRNIMIEMLKDTDAAVRREAESHSDKNQGIAQNTTSVDSPSALRPDDFVAIRFLRCPTYSARIVLLRPTRYACE